MRLRAQGRAIYWILKKNSGRRGLLALSDFTVDERLDDRPQEFPGDDIHHLRAHLLQNALDDGLDQGRVWRTRRRGVFRHGFGICRRVLCDRSGRGFGIYGGHGGGLCDNRRRRLGFFRNWFDWFGLEACG